MGIRHPHAGHDQRCSDADKFRGNTQKPYAAQRFVGYKQPITAGIGRVGEAEVIYMAHIIYNSHDV